MNKFTLRQSLLLLLTATIWGVAFVAQSVGMDYVGPFTFNGVRCILGGVVLLPYLAVSKSRVKKKDMVVDAKKSRRDLMIGGLLCGFILFLASNFQQIGLQYTTVGKAGFVTAMYIVIVPIIGIFLKKRAGLRVWLAVLIAIIGLYLLCMTGGFSLQFGDILVLLCAIIFSFHIIVVDHYSPIVDGVKMSCIQFFTCGSLSCILMFFLESPKISQIIAAGVPILYAGALSCGVAYTLQIVGQKGMNPTVASLIMSLESVISVLAGWILLGEKLTVREIFGCLLMFTAIVLAQLPKRK